MFIMTEKEVINELNKINLYLEKSTGLDFEFLQLSEFKIVVSGSVDLNYEKSSVINIKFTEIHFVQAIMNWRSDNRKKFIELCTEEEMGDYNYKYQITLGHYVFKINAENFDEEPIYIAAKAISSDILIEDLSKV